MDLAAYILLGQEDDLGRLLRIIAIVVFLVIAALVSLAGKIKEKMEQDRARREQEQRGQQSPAQRPRPRRRIPSEEAATVLRQLFGEPAPPPAPPAPPPRRPAPAPRPKPPAAPPRLVQLGDEVRDEVRRMQAELGQEQARRDQRLAPLRHLRTGITGATGQRAALAGVQVDLSDPDAARRAIVFMEIIGRPRALRDYRQSWEL